MIAATTNYQAALARLNRPLVYFVEISGYGKAFSTAAGDPLGRKAWIKDDGIGDIDQSVDPVNCSSSLSEFVITILDYERLITSDFPTFLFEGQVITLKQGFAGLLEADFVTLFTGIIDTVNSNDDGLTYDFNCTDYNRLNQQVIYLYGDDGTPISSTNPLTIIGNPMDILYAVLSAQVGFADHEIDIATIDSYRNTLWAGVEMQFSLSSAPEAKSFIENELLKPLGGYGWTDNLGRYTVGFMQPAPGVITPVFAYNENNLTAVPVWEEADLYNTVQYQFDSDTSGGGMGAETNQISEASVERFGQQGQLTIQSQGVRSGFQGYALAAMVSLGIFNRYAWKNPQLTLESMWDPALVVIGDFVTLTHSKVPNRATGALGIVNRLFQVIGKKPSPLKGTIEWTVIDASALQAYGDAQIAPNGTPAFTAATAPEKAQYLFVTNDSGKQSDGTTGATFA
jgi:hypothetical protein